MTGNFKWLLAAACAAILFPAAAQAQYPYGGYGYGGWGQMNYGQGIYRGSNFVPPYFALHPPVYYSHEINRRPMGASPFAYPSWYAPPSQQAAADAQIREEESRRIFGFYLPIWSWNGGRESEDSNWEISNRRKDWRRAAAGDCFQKPPTREGDQKTPANRRLNHDPDTLVGWS